MDDISKELDRDNAYDRYLDMKDESQAHDEDADYAKAKFAERDEWDDYHTSKPH